MWAVANHGRPQFFFARQDEALEVIKKLGSDLSFEVAHFPDLWFVRVGDQFLYSATTEAESVAFIKGMLALDLLGRSSPEG
jgi:hypothetical protein